MNFKEWFKSKPIWLKYGIIAASIYSLILIVLFLQSFIPSPALINFIFDKIHEILFYLQMVISSKILLKALIRDSYRSWNILFYLLQLILTIIIGFIIGVIIGKIKSR